MELKMKVPQEQIDAALSDEIKRLKKENAALKAKLDRCNTQTAYTEKQRQEIADILSDCKAIISKYADHDCCQ